LEEGGLPWAGTVRVGSGAGDADLEAWLAELDFGGEESLGRVLADFLAAGDAGQGAGGLDLSLNGGDEERAAASEEPRGDAAAGWGRGFAAGWRGHGATIAGPGRCEEGKVRGGRMQKEVAGSAGQG
jgi:hypothetical protein